MNDSNYTPLVSVVTISFNNALQIEDTIKSVLAQTHPRIEYIIIDGGSTDGTAEIIQQYGSRLHYWISEKDNGISHAFNKGLAKASGEIIGLINASDSYEMNAIEQAVNVLKEADISYGDLKYISASKKIYIQKGDHQLLKKEMTVNHPTVFIKQKWYKEYGGFNENLRCAMDYDLLLRYYQKGAKFASTNSVIAKMNTNGISDVNWLQGCKETLSIKNHYYPKEKVVHLLYFLKHVLAIGSTKLLGKVGFSSLVKFYRSKFSEIRRTYNFL